MLIAQMMADANDDTIEFPVPSEAEVEIARLDRQRDQLTARRATLEKQIAADRDAGANALLGGQGVAKVAQRIGAAQGEIAILDRALDQLVPQRADAERRRALAAVGERWRGLAEAEAVAVAHQRRIAPVVAELARLEGVGPELIHLPTLEGRALALLNARRGAEDGVWHYCDRYHPGDERARDRLMQAGQTLVAAACATSDDSAE